MWYVTYWSSLTWQEASQPKVDTNIHAPAETSRLHITLAYYILQRQDSTFKCTRPSVLKFFLKPVFPEVLQKRFLGVPQICRFFLPSVLPCQRLCLNIHASSSLLKTPGSVGCTPRVDFSSFRATSQQGSGVLVSRRFASLEFFSATTIFLSLHF